MYMCTRKHYIYVCTNTGTAVLQDRQQTVGVRVWQKHLENICSYKKIYKCVYAHVIMCICTRIYVYVHIHIDAAIIPARQQTVGIWVLIAPLK